MGYIQKIGDMMVNVTCRRCGGYGILVPRMENLWIKCKDCKGKGKIIMKGKYLTNIHLEKWEIDDGR